VAAGPSPPPVANTVSNTKWRDSGLVTPALVLTARGSWREKVQGIDADADDYVSKPFRIEEALARLRALMRRASGHLTPELRAGGVTLDPRRARVTLDGAPVKLTSHEFRALSYLMRHRGRFVSQAELIEHIYAQDFDRDSNTHERRRQSAAQAITISRIDDRQVVKPLRDFMQQRAAADGFVAQSADGDHGDQQSQRFEIVRQALL
jgi:response regulator RpfG family c-di-GMP phosphodiesterase